MSNHPRRKPLLKLPVYPGGRKAFREFIAQHIRYPQEAIDAKVQGSVIVGYDINDNGVVLHPHIIRGIGHGCDEEALRVIGLLKYEKVKNRRVRVTVSTKSTIHFRLSHEKPLVEAEMPVSSEPAEKQNTTTVNYTITPAKKDQPATPGAELKGQGGITYTITFDH